MPNDIEANGDGVSDVSDTIREGMIDDIYCIIYLCFSLDTVAISSETKDLVIEAKSSLIVLICVILILSLLSILLSTWLAKTITHSSSSFGTILGRYFGFDRNESEPHLTWWTPLHVKLTEIISRDGTSNRTNTTTKSIPIGIPYNDYPRFHTIVLPLFFIGAIISAAMAYYARIKCTDRGFAWGAIPKIPLGRVDPATAAATIAAVVKSKEAEPGVDYTIVQGTKEEPIVFALADTLQPLNEEREPGAIIDEGTQYELEDFPK